MIENCLSEISRLNNMYFHINRQILVNSVEPKQMSDERIQEMLPEHWNPGQSLKELMTRAIALYEEMKYQLREKNDLRTQLYSERLRRAVREIQERTNSEWFPSQGMTLLLEMEEMERVLIEVFKLH